jgi:hypothetical protein
MSLKNNSFALLNEVDDEKEFVSSKKIETKDNDLVFKKYYKNYNKKLYTPPQISKKQVIIKSPTIETLKENISNYYKVYARHIDYDKNWNNIQSFNNIETIHTWYELITSSNTFLSNLNTANFNLFVMKNEISPMWEDNENRHGSRTNIKIDNITECMEIFKMLLIYIANNNLLIDEYNSLNTIQGITFNPKKKDNVNYFIIQIWYKMNFTIKYYKNNNFINKNVLNLLNKYSVYTRKQKPEF